MASVSSRAHGTLEFSFKLLHLPNHAFSARCGRARETLSIRVAMASAKLRLLDSSEQTGPVGILWDIENCQIPFGVRPDAVGRNILMALKGHFAVGSSVTTFSAYGDFRKFSHLREGCQRTGINLMDVPNGRKDASDKAILVDMFLFALDHPPPCTIFLISGDADFAPALHKLGQRGYSIILAATASSAAFSLCNASQHVWDWQSLARGEGCVTIRLLDEHSSSDPRQAMQEDPSLHRRRKEGRNFFIHDDAVKTGKGFSPSITEREDKARSNVQSGVAKRDADKMLEQPGKLEELQRQLLNILKINGGELSLSRLADEYRSQYGIKLSPRPYGLKTLRTLLADGMGKAFRLTSLGSSSFVVHLLPTAPSRARLDTDEDLQRGGGLLGKAKEDVGQSAEEINIPCPKEVDGNCDYIYEI